MLNRILAPVLIAAAMIALAAPRLSRAEEGRLVVLAGGAFGGDGQPLAVDRIEIEQGRIVRMGSAATLEGPVLDARAFVVVPGFIDVRSGAGLSTRNEEGSEVTPSLRALDLVDTGSFDFRQALSSGVTTVVVSPGGRSVIGGVAAALKTQDGRLRGRVVEREVGLVVTLGTEPAWGNRLSRFQTPTGLYFRRPGTRMGVVAEIRKAFDEARAGAPGRDADVLRRALAGDIPVLWRAQVEQDILTATRLAEELGLPRAILVNPVEGHRVPDVVARSQGAILGPFYQMPRRLLEGIEGEDFRAATPKILADAGTTVCIGTGPDDSTGALRDRAILARRSGLSEAAALASITGAPARLLGLDDLGDLAVGKSGDLVVLDGAPLSPTTRVVAVVIEGNVVWTDPASPALEPIP